jgi:hypothetical protein
MAASTDPGYDSDRSSGTDGIRSVCSTSPRPYPFPEQRLKDSAVPHAATTTRNCTPQSPPSSQQPGVGVPQASSKSNKRRGLCCFQ